MQIREYSFSLRMMSHGVVSDHVRSGKGDERTIIIQ